MHDDPAQGVRRKKDSTLVRAAEAVRDGKASAMISAGNTGATMAVGAAADGSHLGRQAPGDRHADPGPGRDARPSCSTPAPTPRCRPSGSCSSRSDGVGVRPSPLRHRAPAGRPAVDRRGAGQGRHACARRPTSCSARAPASELRRQRRGPRRHERRPSTSCVTDGFTGNVVLKTPRRRHEGRRQGAARGVRRRGALQAARRRADAGAAAALRDAEPRHLRRRRAARRRRRVHHRPRLVRARRRSPTASASPATWSSTTWSARSAPPSPATPESTARRSSR